MAWIMGITTPTRIIKNMNRGLQGQRLVSRLTGIVTFLPLAMVAIACSPFSTSSTSVLYADGHSGVQGATAVLGVMRAGSFDLQTQNELSVRGGDVFRNCPVAHSDELAVQRPDVLEALNDATKNSSLNELLPALARATSASLVLLVEVYGSANTARREAPRGEVLLAHGGAVSPTVSDTPSRFVATQGPDLEISAVFFSIEELREVARLEFYYTGPSDEEAFAQFGSQFRQTFTGLSCGSWDWTDVRGVRATDAAGLSLPGVRLVPASESAQEVTD